MNESTAQEVLEPVYDQRLAAVVGPLGNKADVLINRVISVLQSGRVRVAGLRQRSIALQVLTMAVVSGLRIS